MNKIKVLVFSSLLVGVLVVPALGFAQDAQTGTVANEMPEVKSVGLLPTSPFYFIKEFGRAVQTFFTFSAEKKAELKLKIASEKLAEAKAISEKEPQNQEALTKALANYEENRNELRTRLEKLQATSKNPNIPELIQKIDEKLAAHEELFNQLVIKVGGEESKVITTSGFLQVSDPSIRTMWGTHVLTVPSYDKDIIYRVKAINDNVLADLKANENKTVVIKGAVKHYDLEGGFWGIVAEEVMAPEVSSNGAIKIISPVAGDKWVIGETYRIKLNQPFPGEDAYCASLISLLDSNGSFVGYLQVAFKKGSTSVGGSLKNLDTVSPCGNGIQNPDYKSGVVQPGKYKLKINVAVGGKFVKEIKSDYFEIVSSNSTRASSRFCNVDSDCVLLLCAGPFNKEYAKTLPADLACTTYGGYTVSCINSQCTAVK